ncbi:30S ribosomal protein S7 [bacterium]|nr:30S ribosomal protein S7 [bacterium]
MRGKKVSLARKTQPDPRYGSATITKFINYMMLDGQKATSTKIVYEALEDAAKTLKVEVKDVMDQVIANVMPKLEVRSRRIGGANYQVPVPVPEHRGVALALKWIATVVREKQGKPVAKFLAEELMAGYKNEGAAVKKREMIEKMAEANKAFAQFKW